MPKVNVYLPDDLAEAVKELNIPVSAVCQRALEGAVRKVSAIRQTGRLEIDLDYPGGLFDHATNRLQGVIRDGVLSAQRAGAGVGSEHLLHSMLTEGQNMGVHVLRSLEIDPAALKRDLDATLPEGAGEATGGTARFDSTATAVLELSTTEAVALGHNYVGCEHLLLGLIAEPDGRAGQLLRGKGAELRLTRRIVAATLGGFAQAKQNYSGQAGQDALRQVLDRLDRLEQRVATLSGQG